MDGKVKQSLLNDLSVIKAGIDHAEVSRDPFVFIEVRKRLYEFTSALTGVIDREIAKALAQLVVQEETPPSGEVLPRNQQANRT